ncbi:Cro/Cl family transcriptional regulator [Brenneria populi subsp. brevivirga]|uniref:Cro/Cl family transcriptional regulator n=1 Tax=Brenneria populi TaxID=1505588 RepID=UPI002E1803B9|nr:Cro/Cl family transcriptional regulator [Brenneria populi subsp. brevivirga]
MQSLVLGDVIRDIKVSVVASACGLTPKAVYKWIHRGSLPRTEFTGETCYAKKIASVSNGKYTELEIKTLKKANSDEPKINESAA